MTTASGLRRHSSWLARLALSVALLGLLFVLVDRRAFLDMVRQLRLGLYLAGVGLYVASIAFATVRWQMFLRAAGERIGLVRLFGINLVGGFFSMFLPTAVGGDVARMYELSTDAETRAGSVATVVFDRLIGMVSLDVVALGAALMGHGEVGDLALEVVLVVSAAMVAGWWLFFNGTVMRRAAPVFQLPFVGRFETSARDLYRSLRKLSRQRGLLLRTLGVSVVVQVAEICSAIVIAHALGLQLPAGYFFVFMPVVWIVTMLPVSLNGLGVREGAFVFFLQRAGTHPTEAVALSLLVYSCRVVVAVAGGLVFLGRSASLRAATAPD